MTASISPLPRRYLHDGSSAHSHSYWHPFVSLLCTFLGFIPSISAIGSTPFVSDIAPLAMSTPLSDSSAGVPLGDYTQRPDIAAFSAIRVPGKLPALYPVPKNAEFASCPSKIAANTLEGRMHTTNSAVENVFGPQISYDSEAPAVPRPNPTRNEIFRPVVGSSTPYLGNNVCETLFINHVDPDFDQNVTFAEIAEKMRILL